MYNFGYKFMDDRLRELTQREEILNIYDYFYKIKRMIQEGSESTYETKYKGKELSLEPTQWILES